MFKKVLVCLLVCYVIFVYLPPRTSSFLERHGLKEQAKKGVELFVVWCCGLLFLAVVIYDARFNSWATFTAEITAIAMIIFFCLNFSTIYFWTFIFGLISGIPFGILTIRSGNKYEQTQIKP